MVWWGGAPQEGVTRYKTLAASAKNTNRTTIGNNVDCPHAPHHNASQVGW